MVHILRPLYTIEREYIMVDDKYVVKENSTIKDVLVKLDKNVSGFVFCIDDNSFVGIITEGDLRRRIIGGADINETISGYINRDCVVAYEDETEESIMSKLNYKICVVPILSRSGDLVDFYQYRRSEKLPIAQPTLDGNELIYVTDAVNSSWISSTGAYVTRFEKEFSNWCGCKYGVATSNGTTALHLALVALGVGPGDEVIVPNMTFAATINSVLYTGATPVIVDIEEDGWCIDPVEIRKAITTKTKAIILVHIYGQPCDMDAIMTIAEQNNLYVIEDCAEAHGAMYAGKKVGSFGTIGCFSFFGNKVLTTGEGGMCITNDATLDAKMRVLRDHGMSKEHRYYHDVVGFNYRMTNLQAAIGVAQLEKIENTLKWRGELEEKYREALKNSSKVRFQRNDIINRTKINWLVCVYARDLETREELLRSLADNNIDTRAFFIPLSQMEIYKNYVFSASKSERISQLGFNLPTSDVVTDDDIRMIAKILE